MPDPQAGGPVTLDDLPGLWRRSLIAWPDGRRDVETDVVWMQAGTRYGDLRQAPDLVGGLAGVPCLRALDRAQVERLAGQEAFAGTLVQHAGHFEWTRAIDLQPAADAGDRGTLRFAPGTALEMMIEEGVASPYVEHWHRATAVDVRTGAASLWDDERGCPGLLVRVGEQFLYARGRSAPLPHGTTLAALVREQDTLAKAQDLVDCEISIGSVEGWRIARSTLPFRIGATLAPCVFEGGLVTDNLDREGAAYRRAWAIVETEGDLALAESRSFSGLS